MATITAELSRLDHSGGAIAAPLDDLEKARRRALLWLTLVFWGANLLLLTIGTALSGNPRLAAITGMRVLATVLGLSFCYLIHLLLSQPWLSPMRRKLIALAIVAPVVAEIFAWTVYFAVAAVEPSVRNAPFNWSVALRSVALWTWFFLAWAGLYLAITYSFDVQREQRRSAALREQAHLAQLRALHSQINPHFLFNSLNSVAALILDGHADEADAMLTKLSAFLRMGLSTDPSARIPLASEVALQRAYLEIEQMRYRDIQITITLPEELEQARVPALILQPIVENAVKYGVSGAPPPASIELDASAAGECLVLRVADTGGGTKVALGTGIGLANARERLRLMYGDDRAHLIAGRAADDRFVVRISLPLEF